jgi:hypothetical protein
MDSLARAKSRQHVRDILDNLPGGVNAAYDQTMKRIEGQGEDDRELAERVLCWITYALRPLSIEELRHALAVKSEMTKMNFDALVPEAILTSVCAGLVVVDKASNIVRLVRK